MWGGWRRGSMDRGVRGRGATCRSSASTTSCRVGRRRCQGQMRGKQRKGGMGWARGDFDAAQGRWTGNLLGIYRTGVRAALAEPCTASWR